MITHKELCISGEKWLKSQGCGVVIREMVSANYETHDVIGWKNGFSYLVECKISLSDFAADKKKWFRQHLPSGMGEFRLFFTPKGLIAPEKIPASWGLIEFDGRRVSRVLGVTPNHASRHSEDHQKFYHQSNKKAETVLLCSALRRLQTNQRLTEPVWIDASNDDLPPVPDAIRNSQFVICNSTKPEVHHGE